MSEVIHYWGTEAIKKRMAIRSNGSFYRFVRQMGLPVMRRADPRNATRRILYTNESLIVAWELARCQDYRESLGGDQSSPIRILPASQRAAH